MVQKIKKWWVKFSNRNKRFEPYTTTDGFNVLVETPPSKARTEKVRFLATLTVSLLALVTGVVAAVFSVLSYINS